jgi:hypothetical protein
MDLGQKGVFWFTDALTSTQLVELAQRTEELGYAALWYPEALGYESFSLGSFLLSHTNKLIYRQRHSQHLRSRRDCDQAGSAQLGKALRRAVPLGFGGLPHTAGRERSWPSVPPACGNDAGLPG